MGLVCVRDATVCTPIPQSYTDQQPGQEYAGASRHPGIPAVQVTPMILPDESHAGYGSVAAAAAAALLRTGFIDGQIEKDAHSDGREGAPCSMFQNRAGLRKRDPWKLFDELRYERPIFEILK